MCSFWKGCLYCIITGASRGIGRIIAIEFAKKAEKNSLFLLLSRNINFLEKTKYEIESLAPHVFVALDSIDFCIPSPSLYEDVIMNSLKMFSFMPSHFDHVMIVHNAGTLGNVLKHVKNMNDPQVFSSYFELNVNSPLCLNSCFMHIFSQINHCNIINISSKGALYPIQKLGYYCAGKAARDAFFRNLAVEEPNIKVLSYAPGPVKTDMFDEAINCIDLESDKNEFLQNVISCQETVSKLICILEKNDYVSGNHIDYYDKIPIPNKNCN